MRAWIFDLDGTLTVPIHDFAGLKRRLGLPGDLPVLDGIAAQPAAHQPALRAKVDAWEREMITGASPAPGALALLEALRGRPCGVLTRNTRETALDTLQRIGLADFFAPDDVVGRHCATPKPSPAGVRRLLSAWAVPPREALVVGDYVDDLRAARAAGATAVWVDHGGAGAHVEADRVVATLAELMDWATRRR